MKYPSEIEKMLHQENREKKRIGSNIYKRTGTRGYTGSIRSPHDLLKGKAKREYEGTGKVMTTNMYDKILPIAEFKELPIEKQKLIFEYWWKKYSTVKIKNEMGCGSQTIYNLKNRLGIIHEKGKGKPRKKRTAKPQQQPIEVVDVNSLYPTVLTPEPPKELYRSGFSIDFNGSYKAEQIQKILNKLDLILQDEKGDFDVTISIRQK